MSNADHGRKGPLKPRTEQDAVVVADPPHQALVMSADEADLSGIRMITEAAKARENQAVGQRRDED